MARASMHTMGCRSDALFVAPSRAKGTRDADATWKLGRVGRAATMPPMNYAKWNAMAIDSEDEDEKPRKPRVTRLDGPSTITIGGEEEVVAALQNAPSASRKPVRDGLDYSKWDSLEVDESEEEAEDMDDESELAPRAVPSAPDELAADAREEDALDPDELEQLRRAHGVREFEPHPLAAAPAPAAAAPSASDRFDALRAKLTRNGAERGAYLWRQTETEVELSILLPAGTRARELAIRLTRGGGADAAEAADARQALTIRRRGDFLFEGTLAYPVEPGEYPADDSELIWEVTDYEMGSAGRRALRLSLSKVGVHGVVVWWARAMLGEPELDTLSLPDRKRAPKANEAQAVWEEAQRMFRERAAERAAARVPVEMDDESPGGDGAEPDAGAD